MKIITTFTNCCLGVSINELTEKKETNNNKVNLFD